MTTKISISNFSEFCLKSTAILLNELDLPNSKVWINMVPESIYPKTDNLVVGRLIHSKQWDTLSNLVVSIILSNEGSTGESQFQNILILKGRIKKNKVLAYAAAFNSKISLTKPLWQKSSSKVFIILCE